MKRCAGIAPGVVVQRWPDVGSWYVHGVRIFIAVLCQK
jgi:hypothetical protein